MELKPDSTTGQAAYKDGDNPNRRRTTSGPHAKALNGQKGTTDEKHR